MIASFARGLPFVLPTLVVAFASGTTAAAQSSGAATPTLRLAPWLAADVGYGSVGLSCDLCTTDRTTGGSLALRGGATVAPGLKLGLSIEGWRGQRAGSSITQEILSAGPILRWVPRPGGSWFFDAGLDVFQYRAGPDNQPNAARTRADLTALRLGAGYALRLSTHVAVTPLLSAQLSTREDIITGSNAQFRARFSVLRAGLGVAWR